MKTKVITKKVFLTVCASLGYLLLMPVFARLFWWKNKWRILRYHSVSDGRKHETNVRIAEFKRQMDYLKKNCNVISMRNAVAMIAEGSEFKNDFVTVTFDDGYMDNYTNAYPALRSLNIPAVIFLISDYIGEKRLLYHDEKDNPEYNYLLNWEQIKGMDKELIEFGSHTSTHFRLSEYNEYIFDSEITASKQKIEEKSGREAPFISYPFGTVSDFTPEWKEHLKRACFLSGSLAAYGWNGASSDLFELKRIGIESSDTLFTFKAKLNGALDPFLIFAETSLGRKLKWCVNKLLGAIDYW